MIRKIIRWRRAKRGARAIVAAYKAGDFENASFDLLGKYGIEDITKSTLDEPAFILSGLEHKEEEE
jgi:hypothetical protein